MENYNRIKVILQFGRFKPDLPEEDNVFYCDAFLAGGIGVGKVGEGPARITIWSKDGSGEQADKTFEFVIWATHMTTYLLTRELDEQFTKLVIFLRAEAMSTIAKWKDKREKNKWLPSQKSIFSNS